MRAFKMFLDLANARTLNAVALHAQAVRVAQNGDKDQFGKFIKSLQEY